MITKTTYVLNLEELHEALREFLNKDADEQHGPWITVDILLGVNAVLNDGVITAVEFRTESTGEGS